MAKSSKSTKGTVRIPFDEMEEGMGRFRVPEGDYKFKIAAVKQAVSENSGNSMIVVDFQGLEGKVKGRKVRGYFPLTKKALWKLRDLLTAVGMEVPRAAVNLKLKSLIGKELGVTLSDDEYEGKISSKPTDFIDLETLESGGVEDEDEDDEDDEEDSDTDDEDEDEDIEDLDLDDEI